MKTVAHCQSCGAPVAEGALFCSRCGVDVTVVLPADAPTVATPVSGAGRVRATMRQTLREATLGEYEILDELGRGGMATVFLAHDIALDRKVAIKVMAPHLLEGEGMAERFKLEARTAAQLSHPHIIPIYAVKHTEATLFFVMKYVEGKPLDDIIKKTGPLPIPTVRDILAKVGAALGYAHRRNVIHRDVKPGNIMIDEEGTPIVTDFGIAKVATSDGLTITGTTIGTPAYMSPEQCEAKAVTGQSDQYSLGIVAWEMLTGQVPFSGDSAVTTMYKHCHEPLPPLVDFRPDCPPELVETVTRMLAKDPADRWPSLEAAVRKLGSSSEAQFQQIASLLELAGEGDARELMARLSTPRSPMPGLAPTGATPAAQPARGPRRGRRLAYAGVAVLGVAVVGALAVLRPWEGAGPFPGMEGAGAAPAAGAPSGSDDPDAAQRGVATAAAATTGQAEPEPQGGAGGGGPQGQGGAGASGGGAAEPPAGGPPTPATSPATAAPPPAVRPEPARVATVRITGPRSGLEPGDEVTLAAEALDARGEALGGRTFSWTATDESVGRVAANGVFTARAPGTTVVTASVDGVSGSVTVEVARPAAASVDVSPTALSLSVGETGRVSAVARTAAGDAVSGAEIAWRSSDASVASVDAAGTVTANAAGEVTISAAVGGVSGSVRVSVAAPALPTRAVIEQRIAAYAQALESGDIDAVRRAYPNLTAQQERALRDAMPSMQRATLAVQSVEERGDVATAVVTGEYVFSNDGRIERTPVRFVATFERTGNDWRMVRTQ